MPTARTKNDGCSIILHQTNDAYYHWLCPNCKCENVAPVSGVDISQYLPIVKCHECGFEFGVDKSALPTATETTERDLITEVEELLAKATPRPWFIVDKNEYDPKLARKLLRRCADEIKRLRGWVRHMDLPAGE